VLKRDLLPTVQAQPVTGKRTTQFIQRGNGTRAEDRAAIGDEIGCLRDLEAAEAALRPSATHFFGPRTPGAIRGTCVERVGGGWL
jgi:hypothetical protein